MQQISPALRRASKLSIAPMVDYTNLPFRILMRKLSPNSLVYSEMLVDRALIDLNGPEEDDLTGKASRYWRFLKSSSENNVVAQVAGIDTRSLVRAARRCEAEGYDMINLNLGCPSTNAKQNEFGAKMMLRPDLPAVLKAMREAVTIPVSVKCRLGIGEKEDFNFFRDFVLRLIEESEVPYFVVHARNALLSGITMTTRKNRTAPPLRYDFVYELKEELKRRDLADRALIVINGGISKMEDIHQHLQHVDGVMLGRIAYEDPWLLSRIDRAVFGEQIGGDQQQQPNLSRHDVMMQYILEAASYEVWNGRNYKRKILSPLSNMFVSFPNSTRYWRECIEREIKDTSTNSHESLMKCIDRMPAEALDQTNP